MPPAERLAPSLQGNWSSSTAPISARRSESVIRSPAFQAVPAPRYTGFLWRQFQEVGPSILKTPNQAGKSSQPRNELLHRNSRTAQDCSQRAAIQFFVIRNYDVAKRLVAAKYHVTPLLPAQPKAALPSLLTPQPVACRIALREQAVDLLPIPRRRVESPRESR